MIVIHWLACLAQILYTTYNLIKWHALRITIWVRANWKYRESFIEEYQPSTEEERMDEEWRKNRSNTFRYTLKKRMLEPFVPADETDPVWGRINKKYNVDNQDKR